MTTNAASFSDTPHDGADDLLGRGNFIASVVSVIENVGDQDASTVLGLIGSWGSGKTSILNTVATQLGKKEERRREWIVSNFNPWYFQDLASLQLGFFRELSTALPKGAKDTKPRERLAKFLGAVAPFGALGGLVGVDAAGMLEKLSNLVGGDNIEAVRGPLEEALLAADQPLLVVIDDVDRLHPEELLLLFKLIRLAGRLPNVHYLLAYDEDTLLDTLKQTGLIGHDSGRRAIDYMEKIVQLRLDVPPLREQQQDAWIAQQVADLAERLEVNVTDFNRRWSRAFFGYIRSRLSTPRAINRFFAQVDSFAGELVGEVDLADFLIVSWLRAAEPLVYRAIIDNRARLVGKIQPLFPINKRNLDKDRSFWESTLLSAEVDEQRLDGIADLLSYLFPRFHNEWTKSVSGVHDPDQTRVAHPDYFDRYFAFGVPLDDISDRIAQRAAEQILAGEHDPERQLIEDKWMDETALITSKLEHYWRSSERDNVPALRWLAQQFELLDPSRYPAGSRDRLVWLSETIFADLRGDQPTEAVQAMVEVGTTPFFASLILESTLGDSAPPATREASFVDARREYSRLARKFFDNLDNRNPLEHKPEVIEALVGWQNVDRSAAAHWVTRELDGRSFEILDLLAAMVTTRTSRSDPQDKRIGRFDISVAERLVGKDRLWTELNDAITEFDDPVRRGERATDETRRWFVLETLQHEHIRRALEQQGLEFMDE